MAKVRDYDALMKRDALGRRPLARLGGFTFMQAFVRGGLTFKSVPQEHYATGGSDDGEASTATVSCLCGTDIVVELAAYPVECECGRWFFFAGGEVLSLCGPVPAA